MNVPEMINNATVKLLILSDNELFTRVDLNILPSNYQVSCVRSREQFLNCLWILKPDIGIICSQYSTMLQICEKVRKDSHLCDMPLITFSNDKNIDKTRCLLQVGFNAILHLPNGVDLMVAQIENLLANRHLTQKAVTDEVKLNNTYKEVGEGNLFIKRATQIVEENLYDGDFNVGTLSQRMKVSRTCLYMKIRAACGLSGSQFVRNIRLNKAATLLLNGTYNISEVTFKVGLKDPKYMSKQFKSLYGITPSQYLREMNVG
jgi:AraC-like DNA-binding protein